MEGYSRNWFHDGNSSVYNSEEQKLELKLGPPGEDEAGSSIIRRHVKKEPKDKSILSLAGNHFSSPSSSTTNKTTSQKRTAPGPVVGWPPVRSFRKNLTNGSSSKLGNESTSNGAVLRNQKCDDVNDREKPMGAKRQGGLFVKINMHGVPIGRKVDLSAHNSYAQLSITVDKLFRGLLAAQKESSKFGEEEKPITGLLDGNGEYTLTYEDNEGDKMLVGDVPWHMFASSVKRLRVIKTSEISSSLTYGNGKQEKNRS
ncbi:Auxin-responsive protein IAA18 [Hirschfeldia incana]|nr:Auxin-responsive protein IAA18 [Hirschfeldia incana]